jgi:hypothetical protein
MPPPARADVYAPTGLRLLICGGQQTPAHELHQLLTRAHARRPLSRVLESGEPGAQQAVGAWCKGLGGGVVWERVGYSWAHRPGGMLVQRKLIAEGAVDAVLALPGDDPPGWADQAEAAGLPVWRPIGVM